MRTSHTLNRILRGALVAAAGAVLAVSLWLSGALTVFEAKTWDWRQRLMAEPSEATDDVVLILLDQDSLDWAEEENGLTWPWPREVYAVIVSFCRRAGARAVAFDVLYSEPSKYGVYDDEAFGAAIEESSAFVGTVFLGRDTGAATSWPPEVPEPDLAVDGLDAWLEGLPEAAAESLAYPRASFPVPEVARNAESLANVQLAPDADGVYRRAPLFQLFDGFAVPSLALAAHAVGSRNTGSPPSAVRIEPGRATVGESTVFMDRRARAILRFRGPSGTHTAYSAAAIIQSELRLMAGEAPPVAPEELEGRTVLFGFSAPGLYDLRSSPVSGVYPGVEIHATMLDNLLSGDFMAEFPRGAGIASILLLALGAGVTASLISGALKNSVLYPLFLVLPPAAGLLFFTAGLWFPVVPAVTAVFGTLTGAGILNYATEGRQKRYIKSAFKQYLSPVFIEELITDPERLKLGGERRVLSIFFSDLQGFTTISQGLTPEELTALLNDYLTAMTDIILEEGGTVDKYEGDAIIAFWNAPLDLEDHALRCVRAALRCQKTLAEMRPAVHARIGRELHMRIGINTGPAVVGNMGSDKRFDYTMFGDAVNLAARLEGVNKQFGTYTMISRDTLDAVGDTYPVRELSRVAVVGRGAPVRVYEPMLPEEHAARRAALDEFTRGLTAYYAGRFAEAESLFAGIADRDPPAAHYLDRCRELLADPPESWDGVWVMTSK